MIESPPALAGPHQYSLEDLLPHRQSMLLIDTIVAVDGQQAIVTTTVDRAWPMAGEQGVLPLIAVELAAQAAGVCNGWVRIHEQGLDSERTGWLVAVKRADFFRADLPFGMVLTICAKNTLAFEKFREITSQLHHDEQLVAEVVLQLYQP